MTDVLPASEVAKLREQCVGVSGAGPAYRLAAWELPRLAASHETLRREFEALEPNVRTLICSYIVAAGKFWQDEKHDETLDLGDRLVASIKEDVCLQLVTGIAKSKYRSETVALEPPR